MPDERPEWKQFPAMHGSRATGERPIHVRYIAGGLSVLAAWKQHPPDQQ